MYEYDAPEMTVLQRMKKTLVDNYGWIPADFEEMTFADIEAEFLDVEEDFRE